MRPSRGTKPCIVDGSLNPWYNLVTTQDHIATLGAIYMQYTTTTTNRQPVPYLDGADVLHDTTARGKAVPWHTHKAAAQALSVPLAALDAAAAYRLHHCADRLSFARDTSGRLKLRQAHFCRVRLCPMCQWRRSLKMHGQVKACLEYLAAQRRSQHCQPYRYIMLTLTVPNCDGRDLSYTLDLLQQSWQRLQRRKEYRAAIKGNVRCVEITYNRVADTYHPHIHALLAVLPSYFASRYYINHSQWLDIWRDCTRIPAITQVDVRKTTGDAAAVAEVTKYATKASDYLMPENYDKMVDVLGALLLSCHKRRFAGWGGVLRDAHRALALDDVEDGDLINTDNAEDTDDTAPAPLLSWDWYVGPRLYISTQAQLHSRTTTTQGGTHNG